jgi:hypothetical protein
MKHQRELSITIQKVVWKEDFKKSLLQEVHSQIQGQYPEIEHILPILALSPKMRYEKEIKPLNQRMTIPGHSLGKLIDCQRH